MKSKTLGVLLLLSFFSPLYAQNEGILLKAGQTLVMPVQDDVYNITMDIRDMEGNPVGSPLNSAPAITRVDYFCSYTADRDLCVSFANLPQDALFHSKYYIVSDGAPMVNPAPELHYRPPFGWMNDPNGSFYHNGEWHLFYQHNFTSAQGLNQCWGHAVSRDLYSWKQLPVALYPDSLGNCWSGTCVVDRKNAAGFGKDAVLAFYTSCATDGTFRQCNCLAYSLDGGRSFKKYDRNPIIGYRDTRGFRDPKVFWSDQAGMWLLIATRDEFLEIYCSDNLRDWEVCGRIENPFGAGSKQGLECPDLFPMRMGDLQKWVLLVSTPGKPGVGYSVYYQIGSFNGREFVGESGGWLDYGFEFYAAQTFSHAEKPTVIAWASNWKYLYLEPAAGIGYRGEMCTPRNLYLMEYNNKLVLGSWPVSSALGKGKRFISRKTVSDGDELQIGKAVYGFDSDKLVIMRGEETTSAPLEKRKKHDLLIIRYGNRTEMFVDGGAVALTVQDR